MVLFLVESAARASPLTRSNAVAIAVSSSIDRFLIISASRLVEGGQGHALSAKEDASSCIYSHNQLYPYIEEKAMLIAKLLSFLYQVSEKTGQLVEKLLQSVGDRRSDTTNADFGPF
jgi:hypothetical protein